MSMNKRNHDPSPILPRTWSLEARQGVAALTLIAATGALAVGYTINQHSSKEEVAQTEVACTTQLLQPNLEVFSSKYLDADTPAEKKQMASDVARQSRINNPSNVALEQDLSLTSEQCLLVVDKGGEVVYLDPSDQ